MTFFFTNLCILYVGNVAYILQNPTKEAAAVLVQNPQTAPITVLRDTLLAIASCPSLLSV